MLRVVSSIALFYGMVLAALASGYGSADRWQIPLPTRGPATFSAIQGDATNWHFVTVTGDVSDARIADAKWGCYERTGTDFNSGSNWGTFVTNIFCAQIVTSYTFRCASVQTNWGTMTNGIFTNAIVTNYSVCSTGDAGAVTNASVTTNEIFCGTTATGDVLRTRISFWPYRNERAALVEVKASIYGMISDFVDMNAMTGGLASYLISGQAATSGTFNAVPILSANALMDYCGLPYQTITNGGTTNRIKTWFDYTPWRDLNGITSITQAYGTTTYYFGWTDWTNYYNTKVQTNWGTLTNGIFTSVVWTASFITATNAYTNEGWTATNQVFSNWTFCGTTPCGYSTTDAMYSIAFTNADNIADGFTPADYGWKKVPSIFSNLIAKEDALIIQTNIYAKEYADGDVYWHNVYYVYTNCSDGWWFQCDDPLYDCDFGPSENNNVGTLADNLDEGLSRAGVYPCAESEITDPSAQEYRSMASFGNGHDQYYDNTNHAYGWAFDFSYSDSRYTSSNRMENTYYLSNTARRLEYVFAGMKMEYERDIKQDGYDRVWNRKHDFYGMDNAILYCTIPITNADPVYTFADTNYTANYVYKYHAGDTYGADWQPINTASILADKSVLNIPAAFGGYDDDGFSVTEHKAIIRMDVDGGYLFY